MPTRKKTAATEGQTTDYQHDLFGDGGGLDVTDKLDAYEHKGPWQNRVAVKVIDERGNELMRVLGVQ